MMLRRPEKAATYDTCKVAQASRAQGDHIMVNPDCPQTGESIQDDPPFI